jgi:predicted metal-dependent peptidase
MNNATAQPMTFAAARLKAISSQGWPMFRRALMAVTLVETERVERAAIDRWWRIYINPTWFARLDPAGAAAVLCHEIWHVLRFHGYRAKALAVMPRQRYLWNLAADAEIHAGSQRLTNILSNLPDDFKPVTVGSFFPPLPPDKVCEEWFEELLRRDTTKVMTVDNIDVLVPLCRDQAGEYYPKPGSLTAGSGSCGLWQPWELDPPRPEDRNGIRQDRAVILQRQTAEDVKRIAAAKGMGVGEGGILLWAKDIIEPKIDWRQALIFHFQGIVAPVIGTRRWTYARISRRQRPGSRLIQPGWQDSSPRIAWLVDTSGSMRSEELSSALVEISSQLRSLCRGSYRPYVCVYSCDDSYPEAQRVQDGSEVKLVGGGGTDLCKGFEMILKDHQSGKNVFDLVVCLTDGLTPWPNSFKLPILLVLTSNNPPPVWMTRPPNRLVQIEVTKK